MQDNWRVNRNCTIDAGVRFYYITPTQSEGDEVAAFGPNVWSAAQAPRLYQPVSTRRSRRAQDPAGGVPLPAIYIGRLVPGSGNFINGMEVFDGTPQQHSPFKVAPRIGFAWDVTGDGKTAVRGGSGIFYDRYSDDNILDLVELPPVLNTYTLNYTTLPDLLSNPLTRDADRRCGTSTSSYRRSSTTGASASSAKSASSSSLDVSLCRQRRTRSADQQRRHQRPARMATRTSRQASIPRSSPADRLSRFPTISCGRTRDMAPSPSGRLPATATTTRCRCR